jgi:hypothetical protein
MKKILLALTLLLACGRLSAQEAAAAVNKNFFSIGPLDLFFNTVQLSYERQLKNNSIAMMAGFKLTKADEQLQRLGANAEIQYRVSLLYNKQDRVIVNDRHSIFPYFAPYFHYRYEEIYSVNGSPVYVNSGFTGLGFGVRLTGLRNRLTASFFTGGGLRLSDVNGDWASDGMLGVGYSGIAPKIACYIGIAF